MIAIDGNEANVSNRVGSNVYAFEVLKQISTLSNETNPVSVYLKNNPLNDLPKAKKNYNYNIFGPSPLWTQWRLPLELYLKNPKPKLFFTPGHYAPRFSPIPSVITILDLSYLYFPQAFTPKVYKQLKNWTDYSVKNATHILAISEHTKKDIIKHYHRPSNDISVTYLGSRIEAPKIWNATIQNQIRTKFGIKTDYFLFIGTRQPKKNLDRLIKAFNKIHSKHRNISLVIVGKTWHQFSKAELETGSNIIFTDYINDDDLKYLIKGAKAFVFPSLYEGFGIPVLEAMNMGTLVAASNTTSLPEITGDSPLSFKPTDVSQITSVLGKILEMNEDEQKKLIRTGKIRARRFSWERCGRETWDVLQKIVNRE